MGAFCPFLTFHCFIIWLSCSFAKFQLCSVNTGCCWQGNHLYGPAKFIYIYVIPQRHIRRFVDFANLHAHCRHAAFDCTGALFFNEWYLHVVVAVWGCKALQLSSLVYQLRAVLALMTFVGRLDTSRPASVVLPMFCCWIPKVL